MSISDLARERGVDKGGVSRKCAKLEALGYLETRSFGQAKIVNREAFDSACGPVQNTQPLASPASAAAAPLEVAAKADGLPDFSEERAKRTKFEADLKRLDVEERLGRLVEADDVRHNIEACALELARALDALPRHAEALAATMAKEGVAGLRAGLRELGREMRETLARAADRFADDALAEDDEAAA